MRTYLARITTLSTSLTALVASVLFVASALPVLATAGNCPQIDSATGTACPVGQRFWGGTCHATDLVCPNSGIGGDPRSVPSCSAGTCSCSSGSYCSTPATANYNTCVASQACPGGQTFDICSGTCLGDITAVIHNYTAQPQAAQGAASGSLRILGSMQASDFCIAGGGSCLSTGSGAFTTVGGNAVIGATNTASSQLVANGYPAARLSIMEDQSTPATHAAGMEIYKDGAYYDAGNDEYVNYGMTMTVNDAGTASYQYGMSAIVGGGSSSTGIYADAIASDEAYGVSGYGYSDNYAVGGYFSGLAGSGDGYGIVATGNKNYLSSYTGIGDWNPQAFLSISSDGSSTTNPGLTGGFFQVTGGSFMNFNGGVAGNVPTFAGSGFQQTTLTGWTPGMSTTDAATVYIAGAPIPGSNMAITNPWALWVDNGDVRLDGGLKITSGTPGAGKVLTSDASGNATWQNAAGGGISGSGAAGQAVFWTGAAAVSGDNAFAWDNTNKRFGVGDATPDSIVDILSSSTANTVLKIANTNVGDYDPSIGFELAEGTHSFTMGVDDSDGNKFKLSSGNALGTTDRIVVDTAPFNSAMMTVTSPTIPWNATLLAASMDATTPTGQNNLIFTAGLTDGTRYASVSREGYVSFGNTTMDLGNANTGQNVIYAIAPYANMYSVGDLDDNLILLQTYAGGISTDRFRVNRDGIVVAGGLRIPTSAGVNKVLTSDATGNATWQTASSGLPSGTANQTLYHTGAAWAATSTMSVFPDLGVGPEVGIGVADPQATLHINVPGSGLSDIQLTNGMTGTTATDGTLMYVASNQSMNFIQQESANMTFRSNNADQLIVGAAGGVTVPNVLTTSIINNSGTVTTTDLAVDTTAFQVSGTTDSVLMGTGSPNAQSVFRINKTGLLDTQLSGVNAYMGQTGSGGSSLSVFKGELWYNPQYSNAASTIKGLDLSVYDVAGAGTFAHSATAIGADIVVHDAYVSNTGVRVNASSNATYGSTVKAGDFYGYAGANQTAPVYGIYARGYGSTANYGVYGSATSGTSASATDTYGGYFTASSTASSGISYGAYLNASNTPLPALAYALYTAAGRVHIEGDGSATSANHATASGSLFVLNGIETDSEIYAYGLTIEHPTANRISVIGAGDKTLFIDNTTGGANDDVDLEVSGTLSVYMTDAADTTPLVEIENNGTGYTLIAYDQASDTSPTTITAAGELVVGHTVPKDAADVSIRSGTDAAYLALDAWSAGDADAKLAFTTDNVSTLYAMGIDDDDADKFKISGSAALGTTDRFVIDGSGNVGIGTAAPSTKLHVAGSVLFENDLTISNIGSPTIALTNTDDRGDALLFLSRGYNDRDKAGVQFGENDNFTRYFIGIPYNCGSVYNMFIIATKDWVNDCATTRTPELTLTFGAFTSNVTAYKPGGGSWASTSDARTKKDVATFTDGLDVVTRLRPVHYAYNGLGGTPEGLEGIGFIAQETLDVAPYLVTSKKAKLHPEDAEETDIFSIDPSALPFINLNAIKELDARLRILESGMATEIDERVTELEDRVDSLERELLELQMRQQQVQ